MLSAETSLDDVNEAIEEVLGGTAPAPRMVFRVADSDHTASASMAARATA